MPGRGMQGGKRTSPNRTSLTEMVLPPDVAVRATGVDEAGCAGRLARQTPAALAVALAAAAPALSETDAPAGAKPQTLAVEGARCSTMWSL